MLPYEMLTYILQWISAENVLYLYDNYTYFKNAILLSDHKMKLFLPCKTDDNFMVIDDMAIRHFLFGINSETIKYDYFEWLVKHGANMHLTIDGYIDDIPNSFTSIDPRYDINWYREFPDNIRQKFTDELLVDATNDTDNIRRSVLLKKGWGKIELGDINHLILYWCDDIDIMAKSISGSVIIIHGWKIAIHNNLNHIYIKNSGHIKFPHATSIQNHGSLHINDEIDFDDAQWDFSYLKN